MPGWTQSDIDKLRAAIASGVLSVSYAGPPARTITYHSLAEMRRLLAEMTASVGQGVPVRLASTKTGL